MSTVIGKNCVAVPAGIITLAATVAIGLLLWRATTIPVEGAPTLKVIRARADVPPGHCVKPIERDSSCRGPTVSVAVRPLPDAGMVAVNVATV